MLQVVQVSRTHLPAQETQEVWARSPGREDPLQEDMAAHSSILAWRIPWAEEPGGLQARGRKESDATEHLHVRVLTHTHTHTHTLTHTLTHSLSLTHMLTLTHTLTHTHSHTHTHTHSHTHTHTHTLTHSH